jgi:hypothetical protein
MPIVVASVGTLVFGSGTSIATSAPSGVAVGDLLVLCVSTQHDTAGTVPSGWTLGANASPSSGAIQSCVFWRVADGTASDTPTVSLSLSDGYGAIILRITGNDTAAPFDVAATYSQSSGASLSIPAVTTSTASSLLITLASLPTNLFSGSPSGWTTEHSSSVFTAIRVWSKAASGPGTFGPDTEALFTSASGAVVTLAFSATPVGVVANIYLAGRAPNRRFGNATIALDGTVLLQGRASNRRFGTAILGWEVHLTGRAPNRRFGNAALIPDGDVYLSARAPNRRFGTAQVEQDWVILAAGFATLTRFGQARIWIEGDVHLTGRAPNRRFGTATAHETPNQSVHLRGRAAVRRFGNAVAVKAPQQVRVMFLTGRTRTIRMTGTFAYDYTINIETGAVLREGKVQAGFDYQVSVNASSNPFGGTFVVAQNTTFLGPNPSAPGHTLLEVRNASGTIVYSDPDFHNTSGLTERDFPDSGTFEISGLVAEYFQINADGARVYAELLVPGSDLTIRVGSRDTSVRIAKWFEGTNTGFQSYFPYIQASATGRFFHQGTVTKNFTANCTWSWQVEYEAETLGMTSVSASSASGSASAGSATGTGDFAYVAQFGNGSYGEGSYFCGPQPRVTANLTGKIYTFGGLIDESVTFKNAVNSFNARSSTPFYYVTFSGTGQATNTQAWDWHRATASVGRLAPGSASILRIEDSHTDRTSASGDVPAPVRNYWIDAVAANINPNYAPLNPARSDETWLKPLRAYAKKVDVARVHKNRFRYVARDPFAPLLPGFGRGWYKLGTNTTLSVVSGNLRIATGAHVGSDNLGAYLVESHRTENRHVRVRIRSVGSANKRFRLIADNVSGGDPNGVALAWTDATGADGEWVERVFDKYQAAFTPIGTTEGASVAVPYPQFTSVPPLDIIARTAIEYLEASTTYEIEFIRWERTATASDATATVENGDLYGQSETVPTAPLAAPADPLLTGQQDGSWEITPLLPLTTPKPDIPNSDVGMILMVPESLLYESDLFQQSHFNNTFTDSYPYISYGGSTGRSRHGAQVDANVAADPSGVNLWGAMPLKGISFYPGAGNVLDPTAPYAVITNLEFSACVWRGHYGGVLNGAGQEVVHIENGPPESERSRVSVGSNEFFRTGGTYGRYNLAQSLYVDDADTTRRAVIANQEEGRFYWHLWRAKPSAWLSADLSDTFRAGRAWVQSGTIRLAFAQFPDGSGWGTVNTGITGFEPCLRYQRGGRAGVWVLTYRDGSGNIIRRATIDEGGSFIVSTTVFSGGYKFPCVAVTPTGMEHHFARRDSDGAIRGVVLDPQGNTQIAEFTAVAGSVDADALAAYERFGTVFLLYRNAGAIQTVKSNNLTTYS